MASTETTAKTPSGAAAFNVERIRADFPILFREVYGKPLVYLDNGASAQKPRAVLDAIDHAYKMEYANVHRGLHYLSNTATAKFEEAREIARRFLNAPSAEQVIFTKSITEAINLLSYSFGADFKEGDEIVLSIMEHHSNIVPWHFLRERKGCVLKWAPISDDGVLALEAFEKLLSPRTRLVAITHMSNVLGTVVPIKEVVRIARTRGVPVFVDGAQAAVHMPIDVQDLDCDFYAFTGHKVYGPTGIGVLYAKKKHLDAMPPFLGGGEMIETVTTDNVTYGATPHKFEAGTPAILEGIGLKAAIEWVERIGYPAIAAHEARLTEHAIARMSAIEGVSILGRAQDRGGVISFTLDRAHAHDVATLLDRQGIAVRAGHHCAEPLMRRFGLDGTARASFAAYTTEAEVDALADALVRVRQFFA